MSARMAAARPSPATRPSSLRTTARSAIRGTTSSSWVATTRVRPAASPATSSTRTHFVGGPGPPSARPEAAPVAGARARKRSPPASSRHPIARMALGRPGGRYPWPPGPRRSAGELIARSRELDPTTTPSTVYRTLDLLEELGLVCHGHTPDGREEYHVLPETVHGHLHCEGCGGTWEIDPEAGAVIARALEAQLGFAVDLSHVTISGWCPACRPAQPCQPAETSD